MIIIIDRLDAMDQQRDPVQFPVKRERHSLLYINTLVSQSDDFRHKLQHLYKLIIPCDEEVCIVFFSKS